MVICKVTVSIIMDANDPIDAKEDVESQLSFTGGFWDRIKDIDYSAKIME